MQNVFLRYMLQDDPDKVLSKAGHRLRAMIHPLLLKMLPLFALTRLHVVSRAELPKDVPLIFASTHGFKDDIAIAYKIIKEHVYILFGSLSVFFDSFDGIAIWANGAVLVDRQNKSSRIAARRKMNKLLLMGGKLLMYPEGAWNKSPNTAVLKLFPGVYDVARDSKALVVPIASITNGKDSYAAMGQAFDICQWGREEGVKALRDQLATLKYGLMEQHATGKREQFGQGMAPRLYWENHLEQLRLSARGHHDPAYEATCVYREKGQASEEEVFAPLERVIPTRDNAVLLARVLRQPPAP